MIECDDCGTELPLDNLKEWVIEQVHDKWYDEFVFGHSFSCATCGARKDPTEMNEI